MKRLGLEVIVCAAFLLLSVQIAAAADETSLSAIVPDGKWEVAVEGLGFFDGLSCDREGNLYFLDLRGKPAGSLKVSSGRDQKKGGGGEFRQGPRGGGGRKEYS